jgi:hypothetical protein
MIKKENPAREPQNPPGEKISRCVQLCAEPAAQLATQQAVKLHCSVHEWLHKLALVNVRVADTAHAFVSGMRLER